MHDYPALISNSDEILDRYRKNETLTSIAKSYDVTLMQLSDYLMTHHTEQYRRIRINRAVCAAEKLNYVTDDIIELVTQRIADARENGLTIEDGKVKGLITNDILRLFEQCSKNTHWRAEKEAVEQYGNRQKIEHDLSGSAKLAEIVATLSVAKTRRDAQITKLKRVK